LGYRSRPQAIFPGGGGGTRGVGAREKYSSGRGNRRNLRDFVPRASLWGVAIMAIKKFFEKSWHFGEFPFLAGVSHGARMGAVACLVQKAKDGLGRWNGGFRPGGVGGGTGLAPGAVPGLTGRTRPPGAKKRSGETGWGGGTHPSGCFGPPLGKNFLCLQGQTRGKQKGRLFPKPPGPRW